jgi:hypothetical protein
MKNPRPQAQRLAHTRRCTIGEDPRTRGTRSDGIGQSWNGPISPTIRGRVKKTEYSGMSRGGTSRMPKSSITLLSRRGSTRMGLGGSHLSPIKGSGLVMLLKSCGTEEGLVGPHWSRVQSRVGVNLSLSAPTRR